MEIEVDGHRPIISFRACAEHAFPCRFRRPTDQEVVAEVTSRSYLPGDVWPRFVSGHVRRTVPGATSGEREQKADGEGGSIGRASVLLQSRQRVHVLRILRTRRLLWAAVFLASGRALRDSCHLAVRWVHPDKS